MALGETARFVYLVWKYNRVLKWSPERWARRKDRAFRRLLHHAAAHSPYYRRRLAGLDLDRCTVGDLPVLTKPELMEHFDEIVTDPRLKREEVAAFVHDESNLGKYYLGRYVVSHTSGSQGQPALLVQDQDQPLHLFAMQVARGHAMPKTWGTMFK